MLSSQCVDMPWKHRLPRSLGLQGNPKVNYYINSCWAWDMAIHSLLNSSKEKVSDLLITSSYVLDIMMDRNSLYYIKICLLEITISFSWFYLSWQNFPTTTLWGSYGLMCKLLGKLFLFLLFSSFLSWNTTVIISFCNTSISNGCPIVCKM